MIQARQLDLYPAGQFVTDAKLDFKAMEQLWANGTGGAIHDLYPHTAEEINTLQKYAREKTRLGIPFLFMEECLHGLLQVTFISLWLQCHLLS